MVLVYSPWNHKKLKRFSDDFWGYKMGTLGRNGLNHFKIILHFHVTWTKNAFFLIFPVACKWNAKKNFLRSIKHVKKVVNTLHMNFPFFNFLLDKYFQIYYCWVSFLSNIFPIFLAGCKRYFLIGKI